MPKRIAATSAAFVLPNNPASVRTRKRKRAHLIGSPTEGIPIGPAFPYPVARFLRLSTQRAEIDTRDPAALHPDYAIHDDGVDIVTDTAVDQALDRVADRAVTQAVAAGQVDDDDIGPRSRLHPPDIGAAHRPGALQRLRFKNVTDRRRVHVAA